MLKGPKWVKGFTPNDTMIVSGIRSKFQYDKEGHTTGAAEAVRITAISQDDGEINVDLYPFTQEKLDRCRNCFGMQFTISDLVGVTDCKIFVYKNALRVTITAADFQPKFDI